MKTVFITILIVLLLSSSVLSSYNSKVSTRLDQLLSSNRLRNNNNNNDNVNLWVYFTDKGNSKNNKRNEVHPNTLKRRSKMEKENRNKNNYNNNNNYNDIHVNTNYIEKIKEVESQIKVRRESRWLNAISISLPHSTSILERTIERISEFYFVSSVDVVASYKRHGVTERSVATVNNNNNINNKNKRRADTTLDYGDTLAQLSLINVPTAHDKGLNGTGVTVIILDSGYDKAHRAISSLSIIAEYDFLDGDNNTQSIPPDSQNYHGTACLSNLGGWDPGNLIGAGFGAKFILAKTEDTTREVRTEEDNFIAAVEWGESLGADVISASLGYTDWYPFADRNGTISPVTRACDTAASLGITVVVAAGNLDSRGIATPADGTEIISVASVNANMAVSGFSSLGPSSDGRVKPEVAARGESNYIANAPTSNTTNPNPYTFGSGTSYACPLVAGAVAIILQAHPDWTPAMVKEALQMTASNAQTPSITIGWGVIDVVAAVNYLPKSGDCTTNGCSSHGCCVSSTCQCAPGYFGRFCEFKRVECVSFCNVRSFGSGQCLSLPNHESYRCSTVGKGTVDTTHVPSCAGCPIDDCGICFGFNDTCCETSIDNCGICGGDSSTCATPAPSTQAPSATTTTTSATIPSSSSFMISPSFLLLSVILCFCLYTNLV